MQPFSITTFATTGDPEGIRHVEKSNWSGCGVVFPRHLVNELKSEPGNNQAGVYILVGNAGEEMLYIGEADPVGRRMRDHLSKDNWMWGVYFFDSNNKIGKTEVQYLESELVALAKKCKRAILTNRNDPAPPTISLAAKAAAQAFLSDILLILPMLGINAFSKSSVHLSHLQSAKEEIPKGNIDTIVVPAHEDGFKAVFLNEHCWYTVRVGEKYLPLLKYIAGYQVAPVSAITHIAEIKSIVPFEDSGKYKVIFKHPAEKIQPIRRTDDSKIILQSSRYASMDKLKLARNLDEVWK